MSLPDKVSELPLTLLRFLLNVLNDEFDDKLLVGFVLRYVWEEAFLALAEVDADASDDILPVRPVCLVPRVPGEAPRDPVQRVPPSQRTAPLHPPCAPGEVVGIHLPPRREEEVAVRERHGQTDILRVVAASRQKQEFPPSLHIVLSVFGN